MVCVPQLRSHKDILSLNAGFEGFFQPIANLIFVSVYEGSIDVPVPHLERMCNCIFDL